MPDVIDSFSGEYRFLSNFHPSPVEMKGIVYPTVEHAFQAAKTLDSVERRRIAELDTPGKAKRAGRKVELREDWEQIKVKVMHWLVTRKFEDPQLAELLRATGDVQLIEGNYWGDRFWGVCEGQGLNWLGRVLMDVRSKLPPAD
jgi:ribA/ribD-fused uncharacterized protein